ncbi:MAG TPA: sigma-54 dependent transcriptional regulator [Anaeromyxobacteraceae bacterium]|nr:sigma-54 dependent transcriptional regulator [Anaeromyxobacteraceae bacterium]
MPKTRAPAPPRRCLVVSPQPVDLLLDALRAAGFQVTVARSAPDALEQLERDGAGVAIVDQVLGADAIGVIASRGGRGHAAARVVVLGAAGSVQEAVDAMQQGAMDYLPPPLDAGVLLARVRRLLEERAPAPPARLEPGFMGLVGSSEAARTLLARIEKISRYRTNVLLLGESGSGKELVARALHANGPRRNHLFLPLNCATLGHDIIENELFGHEKGAFTGANERKRGLFELADGGTLFLDEIAEMDPTTQAKLLRVLERNEFRRVGGAGKVKVDLSVIAATNRDLEEAIRAGKFREDLYYRLKVVTIRVPALRERKEDIPALIDSFIAGFNRRHAGKIEGIAPKALRMVMEYSWPGNVRELKNAIDSAAILASGDVIGPEAFADLAVAGRAPAEPAAASRTAGPRGAVVLRVGTTLADAERELILTTLEKLGAKADAAEALGIGLRTLYTKLREYRATRRTREALSRGRRTASSSP